MFQFATVTILDGHTETIAEGKWSAVGTRLRVPHLRCVYYDANGGLLGAGQAVVQTEAFYRLYAKINCPVSPGLALPSPAEVAALG